MRIYLYTLLSTFWLLFIQPDQTRADDTTLIIHSVNFPPYEIEKPRKKKLRGFDAEVVIEAFRRVGRKAEVEFRPWNRIVAMAKAGKTMAMLSCEKSPGREKFIYFSNPISQATRTYAASRNFNGQIPQSMEDARGLQILVIRGYAAEKELKLAEMSYKTVMDDISALRILLKRDYDLFYTVREYVEYTASGMGLRDKFQYFETGKKGFYHLCFSQIWPNSKALRDQFNKGLAEIIADGTYKAIHAKYK